MWQGHCFDDQLPSNEIIYNDNTRCMRKTKPELEIEVIWIIQSTIQSLYGNLNKESKHNFVYNYTVYQLTYL